MILLFMLVLLPMIALPAFWLLPLGWATSQYLASVLLSGSRFRFMCRNHKIPVATGVEAWINHDAEVISKSTHGVR